MGTLRGKCDDLGYRKFADNTVLVGQSTEISPPQIFSLGNATCHTRYISAIQL